MFHCNIDEIYSYLLFVEDAVVFTNLEVLADNYTLPSNSWVGRIVLHMVSLVDRVDLAISVESGGAVVVSFLPINC